MCDHPSPAPIRRQSGAALAVSLLMLVILTLIGIAAMRVGRLELRLSQNAESRVNAQQRAQSLADAVLNQSSANLPIQAGTGALGCFISGGDTAPAVVPFSCNGVAPTLPSNTSTDFGYSQVTREQPEFVTPAALRDGTSGRSYDFARFTVVAGYDNTGNGMGAAEVGIGVLRLHVQPTGVTYQ